MSTLSASLHTTSAVSPALFARTSSTVSKPSTTPLTSPPTLLSPFTRPSTSGTSSLAPMSLPLAPTAHPLPFPRGTRSRRIWPRPSPSPSAGLVRRLAAEGASAVASAARRTKVSRRCALSSSGQLDADLPLLALFQASSFPPRFTTLAKPQTRPPSRPLRPLRPSRRSSLTSPEEASPSPVPTQ